jgi:hypothetical protein
MKKGDFVNITRYAALMTGLDENEAYEIIDMDEKNIYLDDAEAFPIQRAEVVSVTDTDHDDTPMCDREEYASPIFYQNFADWMMDVVDARMGEIELEVNTGWSTKDDENAYKEYVSMYTKFEEMAIAINQYGDTFTTKEIIEGGLLR